MIEIYSKGLCRKHYNASYKEKNKKRLQQYNKEWRKRNKEHLREYEGKPERKARKRIQIRAYIQKAEVKQRRKEYNKAYYHNHREEILAKKKIYSQQPLVRIRERSRSKIRNQTLKRKEYQRLYQQKPETKAKIAAYWQNPEVKARKRTYQKIYEKNRKNTDARYLMRCRLRILLLNALNSYGKGKQSHADEYGIDYGAIINHLGPRPNGGKKYVIDHILPLCSFDLTDPEQIKKAFAPENHRWLPRVENIKKATEDKTLSIHKYL